jgi:hypothetical protein
MVILILYLNYLYLEYLTYFFYSFFFYFYFIQFLIFFSTLWNNKEKNKSKRIKLFEASNLRDF